MSTFRIVNSLGHTLYPTYDQPSAVMGFLSQWGYRFVPRDPHVIESPCLHYAVPADKLLWPDGSPIHDYDRHVRVVVDA